MTVRAEATPNPNAMKFTVGSAVGETATYTAGSQPEQSFVAELLALHGVTSVFMTSDFVTVSKAPEGSWDDIVPEAVSILERSFRDP